MFKSFDIDKQMGADQQPEIKRVKYDRWHPVPREIEDQVVAFYLEGNSALQCSKKFGIDASRVMKRRGIKLRPLWAAQNRSKGSTYNGISYRKNMRSNKEVA